MKIFLFFIFILFTVNSYEVLAQKLTVEISYPISKNIIENELNEEKSRIHAQSMIVEKYIEQNLKFPELLKEHHKNILKFFFYGWNDYEYELFSFSKEGEKINNSLIYFQYSAYVKANNNLKNINFWDHINNLIIEEKLNPILVLELALSYQNHIDQINAFQIWKKTYKGSILNIVSNKLLNNVYSLKFIDKNFKSDELSSNLEEIITLFDMAPFNLDICLQTYKVLTKIKFKTLGRKLLSSCKTLQTKKNIEIYINAVNNEKLKLKQFNINLEEGFLINKIFKYGGNLPIQLSQQKSLIKVEELQGLILYFEEKPNLYYLKKIRDKFKAMDLNLISNYLNNQIGVSQNETYQF